MNGHLTELQSESVFLLCPMRASLFDTLTTELLNLLCGSTEAVFMASSTEKGQQINSLLFTYIRENSVGWEAVLLILLPIYRQKAHYNISITLPAIAF